MVSLPRAPGTYALILKNRKERRIIAGKLGQCKFSRGWYAYVGSAFGPGGLAARVGRHISRTKRLRWHVDYLTSVFPVSRIWLTTSQERLECTWASLLAQLGGTAPVPGFGASDCGCPSHLYYFGYCPGLFEFRHQIKGRYPVRSIRP